jgi:hypothetical protein
MIKELYHFSKFKFYLNGLYDNINNDFQNISKADENKYGDLISEHVISENIEDVLKIGEMYNYLDNPKSHISEISSLINVISLWMENKEPILHVTEKSSNELINSNLLENICINEDYYFWDFVYIHFENSKLYLKDKETIVIGAYFSCITSNTLSLNFVTKNQKINHDNKAAPEDILYTEKSLSVDLSPLKNNPESTIKESLEYWKKGLTSSKMLKKYPHFIADGWDEIIEDAIKLCVGSMILSNNSAACIKSCFTHGCPDSIIKEYNENIRISLSSDYSEKEIENANEKINEVLIKAENLDHYRIYKVINVDKNYL